MVSEEYRYIILCRRVTLLIYLIGKKEEFYATMTVLQTLGEVIVQVSSSRLCLLRVPPPSSKGDGPYDVTLIVGVRCTRYDFAGTFRSLYG